MIATAQATRKTSRLSNAEAEIHRLSRPCADRWQLITALAGGRDRVADVVIAAALLHRPELIVRHLPHVTNKSVGDPLLREIVRTGRAELAAGLRPWRAGAWHRASEQPFNRERLALQRRVVGAVADLLTADIVALAVKGVRCAA